MIDATELACAVIASSLRSRYRTASYDTATAARLWQVSDGLAGLTATA